MNSLRALDLSGIMMHINGIPEGFARFILQSARMPTGRGVHPTSVIHYSALAVSVLLDWQARLYYPLMWALFVLTGFAVFIIFHERVHRLRQPSGALVEPNFRFARDCCQ